MNNIFKETLIYLSKYRNINKANIKIPDYQTVDREDFNTIIKELLTFVELTEDSINSTEEVTIASSFLLMGA